MLHTFDIYMSGMLRVILFIALSGIAIAAIVHIISNRIRRNSPYETWFVGRVSEHEDPDISVLVIIGCKNLWEGDYHMTFRMADGSDITLCDVELNSSQNYFVKYFTKKERSHGFAITQCSLGKHLLIIDIMNEHMDQTLYVPFEIKDDPQEILQCRES